MAFAMKGNIKKYGSLMALISIHFYHTFFLLQSLYNIYIYYIYVIIKAQTMCKTRFRSCGVIINGYKQKN